MNESGSLPHPTSPQQCWPIPDGTWGRHLLAAVDGLQEEWKPRQGSIGGASNAPWHPLVPPTSADSERRFKVGTSTVKSADSLAKHQPQFRVFILFSNLFQIFKLAICTLTFGAELAISCAKHGRLQGPDEGRTYTVIFTYTLNGFLFESLFQNYPLSNSGSKSIFCLKIYLYLHAY